MPVNEGIWVGERESSPRDTVTIGTDVWIGYGSTIISGCSIGDGAIIAAGAVVTRDVDPFAIMAGNPATRIGSRFDSLEAQRAHVEQINVASADQSSEQ
ncbi:DapH/DapD/GlmU-related protein [Microbacterium sp. NPDC056736]|uniref:DapH/DapD/GlmU-related protein n=1 Tax=Microbacterium sp. NPDC056736 TaxID=3345932 RepID=UPI0036719F32